MKKKVSTTGGGSKTEMERCEANEYVFRQGDSPSVMYIVHEGRVEISKEIAGEKRALALLGKGDLFGESAVLDGLPRSCDARAVEATVLIPIDTGTFDRLLRKNPEIGVRIMRKLSGRIRELETLLETEPTDSSVKRPSQAPAGKTENLTATRFVLMHEESGSVIEVDMSRTRTVGRGDPVTGLAPDVDLSEVDPERSSSRQHAKILSKSGRYFVTEDIGTTNGTFVNGARLRSGEPGEITDGDQVRFGLVDLFFRVI